MMPPGLHTIGGCDHRYLRYFQKSFLARKDSQTPKVGFFDSLNPKRVIDHLRPTILSHARGNQPVTVSNSVENALQNENDIVTVDRRRSNRRQAEGKAASSNSPTAARRKTQRRRHIDPTTCERDYSQDEIEFMRAMDDYKCRSGRMFPTCSEVLEVVRDLGYVKLNEEQIAQLRPEPVHDQAALVGEPDEDLASEEFV